VAPPNPWPAILIALALLAGCLTTPKPPQDPGPNASGLGLVAASHPLAAQAGAETLRQGGNAFDAAAAVQFVLNVVEPGMSGIGGGAFIILHIAHNNTTLMIDGRETAPAATTSNQFLDPLGEPQDHTHATKQGYAVGVPGTLHAFNHLVTTYGRLPLASAIEPARKLAQDGFAIGPDLAKLLAEPAHKEKLQSWPASATIYYPGTRCPLADAPLVGHQPACTYGATPTQGQRLSNPDLARTFQLIQAQGPKAFYTGEIATAIVEAQKTRDGRMTLADLAKYASLERPVLTTSYQNLTIATAPPPAGGLIMAQILKLMQPLDAQGLGPIDAHHLLIEAEHLAYADRDRYLGDPDHVKIPTKGLLHPEYLAARRALIDMQRTNTQITSGDAWRYDGNGSTNDTGHLAHESGHTTHFVVIDGDGNIATITTTIESVFGSGITVPGYGFLLNNELTDFDFRPGGANQPAPNVRPRSSMSPTIVFADARPILALGSPGGSAIISTVAQVARHILIQGQDLQPAIDAPRLYSPRPSLVSWEEGIDQSTRDALTARGHEFATQPTTMGSVQAALWDPVQRQWNGAADGRREGSVVYVGPTS
jgi:gamma-glutamyltranspeptidase / glutathione hydrolase